MNWVIFWEDCFELGRFLLWKKQKKAWQIRPCLFWLVWKARDGMVFRNELLSIEKLKTSF